MAQDAARRAHDKASSINAILDAAAEVFATRGYDRASIDDIAAELGSTKGRIYHYYSGKQALLTAVQHRGIERMLASVAPIATDQSLTALERLERMTRAHIACMLGDLAYQRVLLQSVPSYVQIRGTRTDAAAEADQLMELRRRYEQLFTALIQQGQAAGTVAGADPTLTARAVLGTLNWVCVWHREPTDPQQRAQRDARTIHELAEFANRGLRL